MVGVRLAGLILIVNLILSMARRHLRKDKKMKNKPVDLLVQKYHDVQQSADTAKKAAEGESVNAGDVSINLFKDKIKRSGDNESSNLLRFARTGAQVYPTMAGGNAKNIYSLGSSYGRGPLDSNSAGYGSFYNHRYGPIGGPPL